VDLAHRVWSAVLWVYANRYGGFVARLGLAFAGDIFVALPVSPLDCVHDCSPWNDNVIRADVAQYQVIAALAALLWLMFTRGVIVVYPNFSHVVLSSDQATNR
jgi:hypothetical protein